MDALSNVEVSHEQGNFTTVPPAALESQNNCVALDIADFTQCSVQLKGVNCQRESRITVQDLKGDAWHMPNHPVHEALSSGPQSRKNQICVDTA